MQVNKSILFALLLLIVSCASQKSMFNKAQKENTIEAYNQFIIKNTKGEYVEKAKAKKKLLEDVVFCNDDQLRLKSFKEFIKYTFRNNTCDEIEPLNNLLFSIADESKNNPELLPINLGNNSFFSYLASLNYTPTTRGTLDDMTFNKNASSLLTHYVAFLNSYESKFNYEYSYMTHNIARVACLIVAKKPQGNFTNISYSDLNMGSIQSGIAAFAAAIQGGAKNNKLLEKSKENVKYRNSLISIYEIAVGNLFSMLQSDKFNPSNKIFILSKLEHWVKIVYISSSNRSLLTELSNSSNSDISESAKKVLSNIR